MVRQSSKTPNIRNIDDIIPFRYAYGDQNGYVLNRGNELSYTIEGSIFKINSGRIVLQGVESDIDANGESVQVDPIDELRYYVVYCKVNLATETSTIENVYDTAGYPHVEAGDDLTKNTSGTASLELYRFQAQNGVISNIQKSVRAIEYSGTALVGYDIQKGTVEERLSRLGFREGSISYYSGYTAESPDEDYIKRQGNYVIGHLSLKSEDILEGGLKITSKELNEQYSHTVIKDTVIGTLPKEFIPKELTQMDVASSIYITSESNFQDAKISPFTSISVLGWIYFDTSGNINMRLAVNALGANNIENIHFQLNKIPHIVFGYEVPPLE